MEKTIIFASSYQNKKFYFDPIANNLPNEIKKEIILIGTYISEKISGIFIIGFYKNGEIFLETRNSDNQLEYDEIGAELEIKKLQREQKDLFNSLQIWIKLVLKNII